MRVLIDFEARVRIGGLVDCFNMHPVDGAAFGANSHCLYALDVTNETKSLGAYIYR
jgi:hypothetical protein